MVTCWWIDTLPASAIFIMLLVKSSSGGRQQRSELGGEWELPGAWGRWKDPHQGWLSSRSRPAAPSHSGSRSWHTPGLRPHHPWSERAASPVPPLGRQVDL